MNRILALIGAVIFAFISISSACTAAPTEWIRFTLGSEHGGDTVHASFRGESGPGHDNNWSADFRSSELVGLDPAAFRAAGTRPVRFSLIREAGKLDCSGNGGRSSAAGSCSLTPDPAFTRLLESRGIARPSPDQAFGLVAVNVREELIDAIAAAHYPTPSIDNLMSLSALGVNGAYVGEMARAGYRPNSLDGLVQFKALDITPQWIAGFVRIGYANVPPDELVQLKALDITPDFIAGFDRIGYRHLPVDKLIQLKAMDITPEFVRGVAGAGGQTPDTAKLIELKELGRGH
jgi:hypothetical protein